MRASWTALAYLGVTIVQALPPVGLGNSTIAAAVNRPNDPAADATAPPNPQPPSPTQIEEKIVVNSDIPAVPNVDNIPNPNPEPPNQPPSPLAEKSVPQSSSPNSAPPPPAPAPAPAPAPPASPAPAPPAPPAPASPNEAPKNTPVPPAAAPEPPKPLPPHIPKENTPSIPQQRQIQGNTQLTAAQNPGPQPSVMPGLYFFPNPITNSIPGSGYSSNFNAIRALLMSQNEINKDSIPTQTNLPMSSPTAASSNSISQRSSVTLLNDFVPVSFSISCHTPYNIFFWMTVFFSIILSLI